jgi:hypothetical protein
MLISLLLASGIVRYFNEQPGFTDAFYHYNAAARIAAGEGFVDDYLWTFIGAPDSLPAPSHLYWMPGTALIAAAGMVVLGHSYAAAQIGLGLTLWGAGGIAYFLGYRLGGTLRHAWVAGSLLLCGGFYMRFWGATDTFAPYAFFGAMALLGMGIAAEKMTQASGANRWWFFAGLFAACGHLIRSDGLLLVAIGVWTILYPFGAVRAEAFRRKGIFILIFLGGYSVVMLPWFLRNLNTLGAILPAGGTQALWYTEYNDLFNYPPDANPQTFFADGIGLLVESRWQAFFSLDGGTVWTFIAIEGMIALVPFILIGAWQRRKMPLLRGALWFAVGIHLAFPLLFPFPGMRGGLFHAVAALMPWWLALAFVGLDDVIHWIGKRRRHWRTHQAKWVFTAGLMLLMVGLSLSIALPRRVLEHTSALYGILDAALPLNARVMINDPAQLYYFTGRGGIPFPNETPDTLLELAPKYRVEYVLLEITSDGLAAVPAPFLFDIDNPPPFLQEVALSQAALPSARLYRIIDVP